ncbi:LANO_0A00100g1_1 [Lachancea nothofagi CBS 11611]|uniref:LANO_0A00100g1_1 n=1 Tax=Lachancea nothofagi CBS 11611 TaxID=1266666 RepID=A0A1G4ILA2_9SACH|nr:LANO_0A00100g1_1 [Lachancea nothofagi CBS 11611]
MSSVSNSKLIVVIHQLRRNFLRNLRVSYFRTFKKGTANCIKISTPNVIRARPHKKMELKEIEEHLIGASHASDQHLRLPRDIFPNKFQYEIIRHRAVLLLLSSELVLCSFLFYMGLQANEGAKLVISVFVVFGGSVATFITCTMTYYAALDRPKTAANRLALVKFIADLKPGIDMREWDVIAARMNLSMHRSSSLVSPYFFYDGESCYSYFRSCCLVPFLAFKSANDAKENKVPLSEYQRMLDHAIRIYERANEDWQQVVNGNSSLET